MFDEKTIVKKEGNGVSPSPLPSPPKRKGFLSSTSGSAVSRKSRSPSPAKLEQQYTNDDERPIYPPSVTQSQTTGRPMSQSDTDISSDTATGSRGHHRRSTDHTEGWHSHTSPMIPEVVEVR